MPKVTKPDAEWRRELTPEQYRVTRQKGTERAFTGEYWDTKTPGIYRCVCCGNELFSAETKFDSGTGWPSFYAPISDAQVETEEDRGFFMRRTEVHCSRCDAAPGARVRGWPGADGVEVLRELGGVEVGGEDEGSRV